MRQLTTIALAFAAAFTAVAAPAQEKDKKKFEITTDVQQQIDEWKKTVASWAADKAVVLAVAEQNKKGPLEGMDNKKWKTLRRRGAEIDPFTTNDAAKRLAELAKATNGVVSEAFLNAQKGEKVAFLEKTSSYLHAGAAKFDVPFQKLQAWQGEPEFDESSQTYAVQISVPVLDPADAKKAVGALVVGLNLTQMAAAKPPAPAK
jgi:hypothetical protein